MKLCLSRQLVYWQCTKLFNSFSGRSTRLPLNFTNSPPRTSLVFTQHRTAPPTLTDDIPSILPQTSRGCYLAPFPLAHEKQGVRKLPDTPLHLYGQFCCSGHRGAATRLVKDLARNSPFIFYLLTHTYTDFWCKKWRNDEGNVMVMQCCPSIWAVGWRQPQASTAPGPACSRLEAGEVQQAQRCADAGRKQGLRWAQKH